MFEQLAGIGFACVFFLAIGPGAYGLVLLFERYVKSCPDGSNEK